MRFLTTSQPEPTWDKHQDPEVAAQLATGCAETKEHLSEYANTMFALAERLGGRFDGDCHIFGPVDDADWPRRAAAIQQRDTGDEWDDGLEVMR